MIQLQIISKIVQSHSNALLEDYGLTRAHFLGYENEYDFVTSHYQEYGNVPDVATFLEKFPDFEFVEVTESDRYLVDRIQEEFLYSQQVPIFQKAAELLQQDSNMAKDYLESMLQNLQSSTSFDIVDIVKDANQRYDQFVERREKQDKWFFTTGFPELDDTIHGIQRGEELLVIFARVNQGKSWVLAKMCTHVWQLGFNVGYVSPEMSASSIGYRFDTLYKNYSNKSLMWGGDSVEDEVYHNYINDLQQRDNKFLVATPLDFGNQITIQKLKRFVKQYKLDLLAIDGITYITDERSRRGDNKTTALTNISEDLMNLSMELQIPILVVVQANRGAVEKDAKESLPELDSIRDSDGIAHNASKVLSIKQSKDGKLEIGIKKQRFGPVGGKISYQWDIDVGEFIFVQEADSNGEPKERTNEDKPRLAKKKVKDDTDIF